MSRTAGRLAQALLARLFLMLCLLGSAALQAQPLLTLSPATDQAPSLDLRSSLSLRVEPGPSGPAPDQAPPELREGRGFKPASAADLNPGYTRDTYWLRLRLHNPQPRPEQRVLLLEPARLESVTLYWHGAEAAGWQRSRAGTDQPFHLRELPLRDQAFVLNLAPGEERVLLLRVSSRSALALRASLWQPGPLLQRQQQLLWFDGMLHSLSLGVGLIALLLSLSQRSPGYALTGLFLVAATLYEGSLRGTSFMLLWPQATDWAQRALGVSGVLATLLQAMALHVLLALPRLQPRLARIHQLLMGLSLLLILYACVGDYHLATQIANLGNTALAVCGLIAGLRAARDGHFMGRIWAVVIASQLLGLLPRYLVLSGTIPYLPLLDYLGTLVALAGGLAVLIGMARHVADERMRYAQGLEAAVQARTAELASAHAELRASDAAKGRLLGYLGHDLRAPLASVLQLARQLQPGADFESNRRAIEQGGRMLLDTLDELQRFARQPEAALPREALPAPLYLPGLLREVGDQAQALMRSRGQALQLLPAPDLPGVVELDGRRLRQVLFNLLSNAAKYGDGAPVQLQAWTEGASLILAVRDHGPGIPEPEQAQIFKPFHRRASSRGLPGLGLGLSIAQQTAQDMGGTLSLESRPAWGSRFILRLPLQLALESQVLWPTPSTELPADLGEGLAALVLDPCESAAEALCERLLMAGFEVECCSHVEQLEPALQGLARRATPCLLVHEPAMLQALPGGWQALVARWPSLQALACAAAPADEQCLAKPLSDGAWRLSLMAMTANARRAMSTLSTEPQPPAAA